MLEVARQVLAEVRKAKTNARLPLTARVERVLVAETPGRLAALSLAVDDLRRAGRIRELEAIPTADGRPIAVEMSEDG